MLQTIRENAQGWFAWVIVILISIPFALWGIQEYTNINSKKPIAIVNGNEIPEQELNYQVQQTRLMLRSLGRNFQTEKLDYQQLRNTVLEDMIRNRLTIETSQNIGLRVGDAQVQASIMATPAFQKDGKFDKQSYDLALSRQGWPSVVYEEKVRSSLVATQLQQVILVSEFTTDQELAEFIRLHQQKRSFKYIALPIADFKTDSPITDTEIDQYYQANQDDFAIPERVKIDYLLLKQTDTAILEPLSEAHLKSLYTTNLAQYQTSEQRHIRHILITLQPNSTPEQQRTAKEKISKIRAQITAGANFADVAKQESEDFGSAPQGGDLGLMGKGNLDPDFEKAAFSLPVNTLSQPIRSAFGWHLIEITQIKPKYTKSFAEVRDSLAATAKTEQMEQRYLQLAQRLSNLAYEHPDSLEPTAKALGLTIQHSDWLYRSDNTGILANPKITNMAFSKEVLEDGNNSEVIEINEDNTQMALVLRVAEHQDITIKTVEEVKERIVTAVRQEQAQQKALDTAEALATRIRKGEAASEVAGSYTLVKQKPIQRDKIKTIQSEILPALLEEVFTLPKAKDPKSPSVGVAHIEDKIIIVILDTVQDGNIADLTAAERKHQKLKFARTQASAYYNNMLSDIRNRSDIWIAPQKERVTLD